MHFANEAPDAAAIDLIVQPRAQDKEITIESRFE